MFDAEFKRHRVHDLPFQFLLVCLRIEPLTTAVGGSRGSSEVSSKIDNPRVEEDK